MSDTEAREGTATNAHKSIRAREGHRQKLDEREVANATDLRIATGKWV